MLGAAERFLLRGGRANKFLAPAELKLLSGSWAKNARPPLGGLLSYPRVTPPRVPISDQQTVQLFKTASRRRRLQKVPCPVRAAQRKSQGNR